MHSRAFIETLDGGAQPKLVLHRRSRCLPGCGHDASATRDIETTFLYRIDPLYLKSSVHPPNAGPHPPFQKLGPP